MFTKIVEPKPVRSAHLCSKKFESVRYYTNLWGDKFADTSVEMRPVTSDGCRDYLKFKSCDEGSLIRNNNNLFTTNKALKVDFPGAIMGFFKGSQYDEVTNCLLEETSAFYRPNTFEMFSPLYDLSHCQYPEGNCLVNNMTMIWFPGCQRCQK